MIESEERPLSAKVAVNTTLYMTGRIAVALSGLLGVAIATRYLGRPMFGQLAAALAFVATLQALPDFGLSAITARELARRPEEEQRIVSNVFTLSIALTAVVVVGGLAATFLIYPGADQHLIRGGIVVVGASLLVAAPASVATAYMTAHQRAAPASIAWILASVLFLAVLLPVVALDAGFIGVAAAFGVSAVVTVTVPLFWLRRHVKLRPAYDRALLRQLIVWAAPQAGVFVLALLYFRFDTILLSVISTDSQVALYGAAYKVIEVIPFLPFAFMLTLFPEFARTEEGSARLSTLAQGALSTMAIAAAGIVVLIGGFAREIMIVIGGSGFGSGESVMRLLAVATGLVIVNMVFMQSLIAIGRQRQLFWVYVAVFALNIVLNVLLIPGLGARGSAIALIASEALVFVLSIRLYRQVGVVARLEAPVRLLAAVGLTAAVAWLMHVVLDGASAGVVLVAGGVATGAAYLAALHLLGALPPDIRDESWRLLRGYAGSLRRAS